MSDTRLIAILVGSSLLHALTTIAQSVGIGCPAEFKVGDKTIKRPKHFDSIAHQKAFASVGTYISSPNSPNDLRLFQDASLLQKDNRMLPSGVSLAVWHEVLKFFAEQGILVERWELKIPTSDAPDALLIRTPHHMPNGDELDWAKKGVIETDKVVAQELFCPGLLTTEQKDGLLGKPYRLYRRLWLKPEEAEGAASQVIVEERHLSRVYYRPSNLLSEEVLEAGAIKIIAALGLGQGGE